MALAPLVFLGILSAVGLQRDASWWWLGVAFAVSWVADSMAHWTDPVRVSLVYPITQSALVGAVLLERRWAWYLLAVLMIVGLVAAVAQSDVFLRVVAWGTVAGIAFGRPEYGRLRQTLLVYFGGGLLAWIGYVLEPGWTSWSIYQSVRALGLLLFCHAAYAGAPQLRLAR